MKRILAVACESWRVQDWVREFSGEEIVFVCANCFLETEEALHSGSWDIVIIDTNVLLNGGSEADAHVWQWKSGFNGKMFAMGHPHLLTGRLIQAGCDSEFSKFGSADHIREILCLQPA